MRARSDRRSFLKKTALGGLGILLLPESGLTFSYRANEKLSIALVGAGGRGASNAGDVASENIVAVCDVDEEYAKGTYRQFEAAKRYPDFRRMLDDLHKEIEAVVVSTPDHTHAVAAIAAMKLGKHVFCEKPLTRTVGEARAMRETAKAQRVVTQMGNQGSASEGLRRAVELAWAGTVGEIREAHAWLGSGNSPTDRPGDQPEVFAGLDWNLWLGPAAERPFHPTYVRGGWRNWRAFGSGALGDFCCHTMNLAFRGLRLDLLWSPDPAGSPVTSSTMRVEARASEVHPETYSRWITVRYEIPARGKLPPVKLTWYNGGPRPGQELMLGHPLTEHGCLLVGEKGAIFSECPWNTRFVLLPQKQFEGFQGPAPTLPRPPGHHAEWIQACKGGPRPFSGFEIGGPMTELAQLGNAALLVGHPIEYDPASGRIVNCAEANALLHREYRTGWSL